MGQGEVGEKKWVCDRCLKTFECFVDRMRHECMAKDTPSLLSGDVEISAAKHAFSSGATSSEQKPAYHLIPSVCIKMLAQRFALGKIKHGDVNYQKCITYDETGTLTLDVEFARDRYDHGLEHLLHLKATGNHRDDNIGAVLWFCALASWIEEQGFDWQRILTPRYVDEISFQLDKKANKLTVLTKSGLVLVEYL